jgi:signal transduction histidine kinase
MAQVARMASQGETANPCAEMTSPAIASKAACKSTESMRALLFGYLLAPTTVAACVLLRSLLNPVLHERGRLITFALAVAISALVGGIGPGLLATALSLLIAGLFFYQPHLELFTHEPEAALTILFLFNSLVICWLAAARDRAARAARLMNQQLEERVSQRTAQVEQRTIELQAYQRKLRSLASELTLAEQRERRRIAVDLHDHIAHLLVMCKLKLSPLGQHVAGADAKAIEQIKDALDEAISYTRTLIFRLSPPVLYELGLEAAVEWLSTQFQSRHDLAVEVRDDKQPKPLGEDMRTALFQSIRELLFNVVKHAGCKRAVVSLARTDNNILITVQDQGAGFDPAPSFEERPAAGLGLFSVRERIDLLGGSMEVASASGHGTRITITAPLDGQSERASAAETGVQEKSASQTLDELNRQPPLSGSAGLKLATL